MYSPYTLPIKSSKFPTQLPTFIEVSQGSRNKYEYDNTTGMLKLDRVLHSAVFYPYDYGFIPQTLCKDGDPLDILVMGTSPLVPGCIADVRPICYMIMADDPSFNHIKEIKDVSPHKLLEISQFCETYKTLEKDKWVKIGEWKGLQETYALIEETHGEFLKQSSQT